MENIESRVELRIRKRAFYNRIHTFAIINNDHIDVEPFLKDAFHHYKSEVMRILNEFNIVKSITIFVAEFEKKVANVSEQSADVNQDLNKDDAAADSSISERVIKQTVYLTTTNKVLNLNTNLNEHYQKNIISEIVKSVDECAFRRSGFTLSRIIELGVQMCVYQPFGGSTFIDTPEKLK